MTEPSTAAVQENPRTVIETDLPSRLDRLPWGNSIR